MKNTGIYVLIGIMVLGIGAGLFFLFRRKKPPMGLGGNDPDQGYKLTTSEHAILYGQGHTNPNDYEPFDRDNLDWNLIAHEMSAIMRPYAEKFGVLPSKDSQEFYDKYVDKLLAFYKGINVQPNAQHIVLRGVRDAAKRYMVEGPDTLEANISAGAFVDSELMLEMMIERERWQCPEGYWYDANTKTCWDEEMAYIAAAEEFAVEPIGEFMVDAEEVTGGGSVPSAPMQPRPAKDTFVGQLVKLN